MDRMRKIFDRNGGRIKICRYIVIASEQLGAIYHSVEARGSALVVSQIWAGNSRTLCFLSSSLLISPLKNDLEDFSLVEASYTLVRILQEFPTIKAGSFERSQSQTWLGYSSHHSEGVKKTTKERQRMTLVISAGDGCPVVCE